MAPIKPSLPFRFWACRRGVTAVEFALVAPIFFATIFALFEAGLLMIKISLLENAVDQAGRKIYTGAAISDATVTVDSLKASICDRTVLIQECLSNITLEATTLTSLGDLPATGATCQDSMSGAVSPLVDYNPGSGSEVSFVRVCVTTGILTPFLGLGLALPKNAQGRYEIISSLTFVNEPF